MDLWLLGYPRAALEKSGEAIQIANELVHPFTHTYALGWSAMLAVEQHAPVLAAQRAEEFLAKSRQLDLRPALAQATVLRGWARAELDDRQLGIEQMRAGIADCRALDAGYLLPFFLCRLAEQLASFGRIEQAVETIADALSTVERTGDRWYESELHRRAGILWLKRADDDQAEQAFGRALAISRAQNARRFELRAATALARLRIQQSRLLEAEELLAPTCAWFDGSLETLDLIDARSVLAAGGHSRRITVS
jgi:predicted ATPase